ncbi:MAG: NADH:flavin oxidoreductase/NADH oxidase [Burkholderiales bacterium]
MSKLFTPYVIRGLEIKNRIWVSPMCQYSSQEGMPTDWHFVHLGSRAVGGAGLVMAEASAVSPEGRISPDDSGIWMDAQATAFQRITGFIRAQGAVAAIQLAHAGRKASTAVPWKGGATLSTREGGWIPWAPSAIPFTDGDPLPHEMSLDDTRTVIRQFEEAAQRSLAAGFQVIELHMAHGYLLHEFLSPLSNRRQDEYGGSFENRIRFPLQVARAVRKLWPEELPLFVRISASDWKAGGWDVEQSVLFARELSAIGVDLIDCSSGGLVADAKITAGPAYQVPFADKIRREAGIATAAVGMITEPHQAEEILQSQKADAIFMAREFLRDPYWPMHAASALNAEIGWPKQYERARR